MHALLQDWTQIEGTGAVEVIQSAPGWLRLDEYSDISVWLEVSVKRNAEIIMYYETAPGFDASVFAPMKSFFMTESTTPRLDQFVVDLNPTLPLASLFRWRIESTTNSTWHVNFRINCVAKR